MNLLIYQLPIDEKIMIFKEILILWGDENSIIKISFNQHFYLSKMLLLIFFYFPIEIKENIFIGDNLSFLLAE